MKKKKLVWFMMVAILMGFIPPILTAYSSIAHAIENQPDKNESNIAPEYTTDATKGTFPTNSWQPVGQTNVINHQGKERNFANWDGVTSWNGNPSDTTHSYIQYGEKQTDFAIRKYAKETSPGLYDVYLNVKGNKQQAIKPVDIVLVVDMSGSMERSQSNGWNDRAGAARDGVKNFLTSIQNAGLGDYVNVGLIGFSSPGYIGGQLGYISICSNIAFRKTNKTLLPRIALCGIFSVQGEIKRIGTFTRILIVFFPNLFQIKFHPRCLCGRNAKVYFIIRIVSVWCQSCLTIHRIPFFRREIFIFCIDTHLIMDLNFLILTQVHVIHRQLTILDRRTWQLTCWHSLLADTRNAHLVVRILKLRTNRVCDRTVGDSIKVFDNVLCLIVQIIPNSIGTISIFV